MFEQFCKKHEQAQDPAQEPAQEPALPPVRPRLSHWLRPPMEKSLCITKQLKQCPTARQM